jgi:hypothetical protein
MGKVGIAMNEQRFKETYIATFLASWSANNYDFACTNDRHDMFEAQPIDDAKMLADLAWQRVKDNTDLAKEILS